MKDITARGYMVSRLSPFQLIDLHGSEKNADYTFTPSMIRERFNLPETGEVEVGVHGKAQAVATAVYEKARSGYRAHHTGCCFPDADGLYPKSDSGCPLNADLHIVHVFDKKVVDEGVEFPQNTRVGRARATIERSA